MEKLLNYFISGHTARGFCSLLGSNLSGINKLFVIMRRPLPLTAKWLVETALECKKQGYDVEILHSPRNADTITGIIIPAIGIGLVDSSELSNPDPESLDAKVEYIDLADSQEKELSKSKQNRIRQYCVSAQNALQTAYGYFAQALAIHDQWEEIYIGNMDFAAADRLADVIAQTVLGDAAFEKIPSIRHRFLGAATPAGPVDFIEDLTENLSSRYFLKGRPGTGKSTLLKKLVAQAEKRGLNTEIYHCGFDPNSLDMVIIRELDTVVMDSTAPHEYFPSRDGDDIIDLYELLIKPGTDGRYADKLRDIASQYKDKIKLATASLAEAKSSYDAADAIYQSTTDTSQAMDILHRVSGRILRLN